MRNLKKFVALCLTGALAVTSLFACGKSPKEKVEDAFKTLGTSASAIALKDELGIAAAMEKIQDGAFEAGIKVTLEDSDISELAMLVSGSVEAFIAGDVEKEKKILMGASIGYAASELLSAEMYVDEEQIAVALPGLLEKVPYIDVSGNLEKKLKKSVLMQQEGMDEIDFEGIADMWKEKMANTKDDELGEFVLAFEDETKAMKTFEDAIEINEIDKKEFKINGKNKKCEGFEIVIPEEAVVEFAESFMDYYLSKDAKAAYNKYIEQYAADNGVYDAEDLKAEFEAGLAEIEDNAEEILTMIETYISDVEAEMYIYEGEIVSLEAEMEITDASGSMGVESFEVGLELECEGGEYGMYDNYTLTVKMMSMDLIEITKETLVDGDEYEVEWKLGGMAMQNMSASAEFVLNKKDGDFEFEASFDDGYDSMLLAMEGVVEVEKKEAVTIEFDSLKLTVDEELMFDVSGECWMKDDAKVKMPEGKKFDVLTDKQSEWDEFMEDVNNLQYSFNDILEKLN